MEYLDRPQYDETSQAHPAYWRGKARGINDVLKIVSDIMLNLDNGTGTNNHPGIESMRQGLLAWREQVDKSFAKETKKVEK